MRSRKFFLGLCAVSCLGLCGVLSSCTAGDEPTTPDAADLTSVAGSAFGPAGAAAGSVTTAGVGNVGGAGANASATGGQSAGGALVSAVAGSSTNGSAGMTSSGGASAETCSDLPPNNGDTCAHAVEYGWCKQDWLGKSCRKSCSKCSDVGTGTGSSVGGGSSGGVAGNANHGGAGGQPPLLEGGTQGFATRYWDCCKPACGWKGNVGSATPVHSCNAADQSLGGNFDAKNACEGDKNGAYMCHDFGPWSVSDTLAYGFAAVKMGGDYCGKCYQLQFSGSSHTASNDPGSQALKGKTMIVQAINTGGVDGNQFDLLIPGGGVGEFDACSSQWGTSDLGERYGGFYLACQKQNGFNYEKAKACAAQKCQSVLGGKPDLLAGCHFFLDWMGAPDNPNLVYKEVACPAAITQLSGLKR